MDKIVITGSDKEGIVQLKQYLKRSRQKILPWSRSYIVQGWFGRILKRKYALNILEETWLLNANKLEDTSMDPSVNLVPNQGELL